MWTTYISVTTTSRGRGNALAGPTVKRVSPSACRGGLGPGLSPRQSEGRAGKWASGAWGGLRLDGQTGDRGRSLTPGGTEGTTILSAPAEAPARRCAPAGRSNRRSWSIVDPRGYRSHHDPERPNLPVEDGVDHVVHSGILASVWCGRTAKAWLRGCQSAPTDEGLRRSPGSGSGVVDRRLHHAACDGPTSAHTSTSATPRPQRRARLVPSQTSASRPPAISRVRIPVVPNTADGAVAFVGYFLGRANVAYRYPRLTGLLPSVHCQPCKTCVSMIQHDRRTTRPQEPTIRGPIYPIRPTSQSTRFRRDVSRRFWSNNR